MKKKQLIRAIERTATIANEANFLWNDNVDPEKNMEIRDAAWKANKALDELKNILYPVKLTVEQEVKKRNAALMAAINAAVDSTRTNADEEAVS